MRAWCWLLPAWIVVVAAGAGGWLATAARPRIPDAAAADLERGGDPERGRLIFAAGDCSSCHASPGQADRLRLGGGMDLPSPLGTFHPPNISPDSEDGIGRWRTIDLANALLAGISPDRQHYYPAFPYTSYAHMRLSDVKDLMAYLRTLPPVKGHAPAHDLPFPFTIRRLIGGWKLLFLDQTVIEDDPARDPAWNRGRYLAEGVGHCAECHSARNLAQSIRHGTRFAGGIDQSGVGYVPNITPTGIGRWTRDDIAEALHTGRTPEHRQIGSTMADVVTNLSALPDSDRRAIATYLLSLPRRHSTDE
ncbi:MAG: cytochrome c [Acetobacteraceae bacterium]